MEDFTKLRPKLRLTAEDRQVVGRMLLDRRKWSVQQLRDAGFHNAAEALATGRGRNVGRMEGF